MKDLKARVEEIIRDIKLEHDFGGCPWIMEENILTAADKIIKELSERETKLVEALKFYANPGDYKAPYTAGLGKLYYDCGVVAATALKELEQKEGE